MALLQLEDVSASYGESEILHSVSLSVPRDSMVVLLGRNGVGKSTLLATVMNQTDHITGEIRFDGESIRGLPTEAIAKRGLTVVPEDRKIFPKLTVAENLEIARQNNSNALWDIDEVYERFEVLGEKRDASGVSLSGGQQQMLAIARAMVRETKLLILDEPFEGLAPTIIRQLEGVLEEIASTTTILIVTQSENVIEQSDRAYVLENGQVVYDGPPVVEAISDVLRI